LNILLHICWTSMTTMKSKSVIVFLVRIDSNEFKLFRRCGASLASRTHKPKPSVFHRTTQELHITRFDRSCIYSTLDMTCVILALSKVRKTTLYPPALSAAEKEPDCMHVHETRSITRRTQNSAKAVLQTTSNSKQQRQTNK